MLTPEEIRRAHTKLREWIDNCAIDLNAEMQLRAFIANFAATTPTTSLPILGTAMMDAMMNESRIANERN